MFSNKIYTHFFKELSKYFLLVLFTFSIIVWTVQAVNFLDLIVDDGHAVSIYLSYSLLNISKIITKFIPLSFLIGLFLTIIKFEDESEFMILWTAGLNKMRVVNFFLKVSLLVTILQLVFASIVNPTVLNHSRSLIKSSNLDFISSMLKSNQFNDTVEGLTIYFEEKDENNIMKNIFIRDDNQIFKGLDRSKDSSNLTIFAEKGRVEKKGKNFLFLENGTIQTENKKKEIQSINFTKTKLLLQGMQTKSIIQPKIQETSSVILIRCLIGIDSKLDLLNCPKEKSKIDTLSEINRRLGMPLYIPCIALLCSFLLISRNESKRKGLYKYFYFGLAFTALVLAEILVRYSGKSYAYSYIYYLLPLISIPVLYFFLFRNFHNENLRN
tara:strand:+ start:518 stop:1666 length:1149 start_codon:yes stop_codon:yes gene_type:complete